MQSDHHRILDEGKRLWIVNFRPYPCDDLRHSGNTQLVHFLEFGSNNRFSHCQLPDAAFEPRIPQQGLLTHEVPQGVVAVRGHETRGAPFDRLRAPPIHQRDEQALPTLEVVIQAATRPASGFGEPLDGHGAGAFLAQQPRRERQPIGFGKTAQLGD